MAERPNIQQLQTAELARACALLGELFDTVQIVCSHLHEDGTTSLSYWGAGNFYARLGSTREFVKYHDSRNLANMIGMRIDPPDEPQSQP